MGMAVAPQPSPAPGGMPGYVYSGINVGSGKFSKPTVEYLPAVPGVADYPFVQRNPIVINTTINNTILVPADWAKGICIGQCTWSRGVDAGGGRHGRRPALPSPLPQTRAS